MYCVSQKKKICQLTKTLYRVKIRVHVAAVLPGLVAFMCSMLSMIDTSIQTKLVRDGTVFQLTGSQSFAALESLPTVIVHKIQVRPMPTRSHPAVH